VLRRELEWWDAHGDTVPCALTMHAAEALLAWLEWERAHCARVAAAAVELRTLGQWAKEEADRRRVFHGEVFTDGRPHPNYFWITELYGHDRLWKAVLGRGDSSPDLHDTRDPEFARLQCDVVAEVASKVRAMDSDSSRGTLSSAVRLCSLVSHACNQTNKGRVHVFYQDHPSLSKRERALVASRASHLLPTSKGTFLSRAFARSRALTRHTSEFC